MKIMKIQHESTTSCGIFLLELDILQWFNIAMDTNYPCVADLSIKRGRWNHGHGRWLEAPEHDDWPKGEEWLDTVTYPVRLVMWIVTHAWCCVPMNDTVPKNMTQLQVYSTVHGISQLGFIMIFMYDYEHNNWCVILISIFWADL